MSFMEKLSLQSDKYSVTENGALGFGTTGSRLVDLNFGIPSYRDKVDTSLFDKALSQDMNLTLRWLLYLRDIRGGVGERKSFRDFVVHLVAIDKELAENFFREVPIEEYGRWDDYIYFYDVLKDDNIREIIGKKITTQFQIDKEKCENGGKNVSLLGKWMPSCNTSSLVTRRLARKMMQLLGLKEREYRKALSALRKHIDVVECKMSANEWADIKYENVPSKANLNYANAFMAHDNLRRMKYLNSLKNGETKINAQALFLHDIVRKYSYKYEEDELLEHMWKAQEKLEGFTNTLVVRDGSGSMWETIPNSHVMAIDVANAITLYCAENCEGQYKNKFITFSQKPKFVDVSMCKTLYSKLDRLCYENDCTNTNIEKVFLLILKTAQENKMSQEDLPKSVLVISDMEFDASMFGARNIFDTLKEMYKEAGYVLPKLIFWNVNSRTNTIPCRENKDGVILLSGFSKNLMQMVMSSEVDPYKALVQVLNVKRYDVINKVCGEE